MFGVIEEVLKSAVLLGLKLVLLGSLSFGAYTYKRQEIELWLKTTTIKKIHSGLFSLEKYTKKMTKKRE